MNQLHTNGVSTMVTASQFIGIKIKILASILRPLCLIVVALVTIKTAMASVQLCAIVKNVKSLMSVALVTFIAVGILIWGCGMLKKSLTNKSGHFLTTEV